MKKIIDKKLFLNINAIFGVIFTAITCQNGTIKDIEEYSDSMDTKEKIKHYIKCYGPTVAFASGTILSIFLSNSRVVVRICPNFFVLSKLQSLFIIKHLPFL